MSSIWDSIKIKKGPGGCGNVSNEQKNKTIESAVETWENMGLDQDQIAFGIAVMGVESGFNPLARGHSKTERGLGQFNDDTWTDAVKFHNSLYPNPVDPAKNRNEEACQVRAMGAWIHKAFQKAENLVSPSLNNYRFEEIAYGLWHESVYAKSDRVERFLGSDQYQSTNISIYFKETYSEALSIIDPYSGQGFSTK